jgi:hypothetical protein
MNRLEIGTEIQEVNDQCDSTFIVLDDYANTSDDTILLVVLWWSCPPKFERITAKWPWGSFLRTLPIC